MPHRTKFVAGAKSNSRGGGAADKFPEHTAGRAPKGEVEKTMYADFFNFAKTGNPFLNSDVAKVFADFDPAKAAEQFTKALQDAKVPAFDVEAMIELNRKNIEALTAANKAATDGAQVIARRQMEIYTEALAEVTAMVDSFSKIENPQDVVTKQAELTKKSFEKALANAKTLSDLAGKSNDQAAKAINSRIIELLDEVKTLASKNAAAK